ncbi:MAG: hypothetical protein DRQ37_05415 [Gammaproteobacteria bacterium]|nr:MAG: hypothetical protein DRQ37_05415 [Gammaproteobacteria bacterium]
MAAIGSRRREKPLTAVPWPVLVLLLLGLFLQLVWHAVQPAATAEAKDLTAPPTAESLRVAGLGAALVVSRATMLWLQAFDNQPGVSIPFRDLDYERVTQWLGTILTLDPRGQYPLLAASRVYAEVQATDKRRIMLDFVYRQFLEDPDRRWRWLAHAAIVAKHRLNDLPLALTYARAITEYATGPAVPFWARDMTFIILEDMGELEAARVLVGGLLDSGTITDPHEIRFLSKKLEELEKE